MFGMRDRYRMQGALTVLNDMATLPIGGLFTIKDDNGENKTFKRVK